MTLVNRSAEPLVEILLATYNGGQYLSEQLDSLFAQTYKNWKLLVHDDGSVDDTLEIVRRYASREPGKITLVDDRYRAGGAKNNFAHLMSLATADYVSFCDQDDIWLPNKLECSIAALTESEARWGKDVPIAVFTDAKVVDAELEPVAPSLWQHQATSPGLAKSFRRLSIRNCVTGCTMMINRAALDNALPIPDVAVMHDWWIALTILKCQGVLRPIGRSTVLYRQHSSNAVGAQNHGFRRFMGKAARPIQMYREVVGGYLMAKQVGAYDNPGEYVLQKTKEIGRSMISSTSHE
ncbi:glycosyltransferase family 2 protein [Thiohalomonas denitrificans]|uniref:Glycosyl transferase family 2 n=1 Tax=Thiohalomonas denitrificans TaxID=415747 RepID=A0A1G5R013_9GAMM|nr:glycosyltransferase family 2 protein [Thiohalomonas denitrificans]SCZ67372.1 Glycosyl transferase family 2 [Thiohalomonas denitrificans]